MKKLNSLLVLILAIIFISACGNEEKQTSPTESANITVEKTFTDDPNAEETAADTSSTGVYQEVVNEEEQTLQNLPKNESVISNQEDENSMSFCDCVKKNKSLTDIIMSDDTSDKDFDKAMEEIDAMKDGACNIMFPQQNNIEEQQKHQQLVKNCLN